MEPNREKIHFDETPHFTAILKFCQRIKSFTFNWLLNHLIKLFYAWGEKIRCTTINSGFTRFSASHYYSWRPGKTRKQFLKTSIAVDTSLQIIPGLKISQHPVHDILHAEKCLNNATGSDILTSWSWIKDTILKRSVN